MTRYEKYMQHIHNAGTANTIENAVTFLVQDIIDFLVKTGIKPDCNLIKEIRNLGKYTYKQQIQQTNE